MTFISANKHLIKSLAGQNNLIFLDKNYGSNL